MRAIRRLTLLEVERKLKMNNSLIEMLKGNTDLEDIAKFRELWVEPLEALLKELKINQTIAE
jgi:hypothetical protein